MNIVFVVFCGIIALIMLTTITWDVPVVETYPTYEPYDYEDTLVRESQIRKFPWFSEVTRVQYLVTNTDAKTGTFALNFTFDNGIEIATLTETVAIGAGEERAMTVDSPLKGVSRFTVNVIPPGKSVLHERTVTKKFHVWDVPLWWLFFRSR
jgi:hypothetical protein